MKLKGLAVLTTIMFLAAQIGNAYAAAARPGIDGEEHETDMWVWMQNGKIIYPVTPTDEIWQSLCTTTERVDACRILEEMTTLQLLLAAIDYPMSGPLYMYSDMETGFEVLTEYCGALEELLSRSDCMETVTEYYLDFDIPENKIVDWSLIIDN